MCDLPIPDFRAVMQDMATAFAMGEEYTLVDGEVEVVYLSLCRLEALEELAQKRDWEGIEMYTPRQEGAGDE